MEEKEQIKPLTVETGEAGPATAKRPSSLLQGPRNWRCVVLCGGCCSAVVAVIGLIMLVLALTVFKVKDPVLTLNNMYIDNLQVSLSTPNHPISINATLIADMSIKNPNKAALQFDSSATKFYYMGETVGVGYAPWTEVPVERTARMNVTVNVFVNQVAVLANATGSVVAHGYVNLTSSTDVRARVSVIGVFNRGIGVVMNCSMSLDVPLSSQQVKYRVCQAYVE